MHACFYDYHTELLIYSSRVLAIVITYLLGFWRSKRAHRLVVYSRHDWTEYVRQHGSGVLLTISAGAVKQRVAEQREPSLHDLDLRCGTLVPEGRVSAVLVVIIVAVLQLGRASPSSEEIASNERLLLVFALPDSSQLLVQA